MKQMEVITCDFLFHGVVLFDTMLEFSLFFVIYIVDSKDLENGSSSAYKAKAGTAVFLIELEKRRSIKACSCV